MAAVAQEAHVVQPRRKRGEVPVHESLQERHEVGCSSGRAEAPFRYLLAFVPGIQKS